MKIATKDISPAEAKEAFNDGIEFIDIREPEEYEQERIPGAQLIPMSEINSRLKEIPQDKEAILYCRTGNRSAYVLNILSANGYDNLYHLEGGIQAWYNQGHPVNTEAVESKYGSNTFEGISAAEAHEKNSKNGSVLIDVREPYEYRNGHPENAVNIPLDSIQKRAEEYDADDEIMLICASGNRSSMAANWLTSKGFSNVSNVKGGMMAWQSNRLPVEE